MKIEFHHLGIEITMHYIDPHIHMISRTTDDYQRMAFAGWFMATRTSQPAVGAALPGISRRTTPAA